MARSTSTLTKRQSLHDKDNVFLIRHAWLASVKPLAVRCFLFAASLLLLTHPAVAQTQGKVVVDSADFTLDTAGALPAGQGVAQADSANFTVDTAGALPAGQGLTVADSANFALDTTGAFGTVADSADFTVNTMPAVVAFRLLNPIVLPGGLFQFSFTNFPGVSFSVFGATNLAVPFSNWISLGTLTDNPPGIFQFTDSQMTNYSRRFYRVTSP